MRTDLTPAAIDLATRTIEILESAFEEQKDGEGEWLQIDAKVATALHHELYAMHRQVHYEEDTRLRLMNDGWMAVEVVCDGADRDFAYVCCLKPGHKGDCYSSHKRVDFRSTR